MGVLHLYLEPLLRNLSPPLPNPPPPPIPVMICEWSLTGLFDSDNIIIIDNDKVCFYSTFIINFIFNTAIDAFVY